ncbi:hypothetical protein NDU88_000754 [Pleurodeles waltl]|uniref:Uncharacterized protein n=1 Tax=Pleurodeles waltl TaxID=8319 RepID=A0AAV7KQ92_PLEWA|nr:hypothetical protein NDU88_000754 [Pleurodeles waltl]
MSGQAKDPVLFPPELDLFVPVIVCFQNAPLEVIWGSGPQRRLHDRVLPPAPRAEAERPSRQTIVRARAGTCPRHVTVRKRGSVTGGRWHGASRSNPNRGLSNVKRRREAPRGSPVKRSDGRKNKGRGFKSGRSESNLVVTWPVGSPEATGHRGLSAPHEKPVGPCPMRPILLLLISTASMANGKTAKTTHRSTTMDSATASTSGVTPPLLLPPTLTTTVIQTGDPMPPPDELWQPWSSWICNCAGGSMARVRELSYVNGDVTFSNQDLDRHRFQRVACTYSMCPPCKLGQCDHEHIDCPIGEDYQCAVLELGYNKDGGTHISSIEPRDERFWEQISIGVHSIWNKLKRAFQPKKGTATGKAKSRSTAKASTKRKQSTIRR